MRLSAAEYEIMQVIWQKEGPATSRELQELSRRKGWKAPTLASFLKRLCEKGALTTEKQGKTRLYRPALGREAYLNGQARALIQEWYGGRVSELVAGLAGQGGLTEEDRRALRRLLNEEWK